MPGSSGNSDGRRENFYPKAMIMNDVDVFAGVQHGWTVFMGFVPKALLALLILVVGYFLARLIARGIDTILERLGFNQLVERGGIRRALERTDFDASDIICKIVFYTLVLLVLQLAFSVFGPNPVSQILTTIIAYLPNVFVAVIIVVLAAAIAAGAKQLLLLATSALPYGRLLSNFASIIIIGIGIFAALDQLKIAPRIVQGLFYAALATMVGSAIVAIGGGGIVPMRRIWDKALGTVERELPRAKAEISSAAERIEIRSWKEHLDPEHHHEESHHPENPRF